MRPRPRPFAANARSVRRASSTPWLTATQLRETGGVVVWRAADTAGTPPADIARQFPDLAAVQAWTDANAMEAVADRVQRGLYVPMNRFEVAMAKRKLPAAGA